MLSLNNGLKGSSGLSLTSFLPPFLYNSPTPSHSLPHCISWSSSEKQSQFFVCIHFIIREDSCDYGGWQDQNLQTRCLNLSPKASTLFIVELRKASVGSKAFRQEEPMLQFTGCQEGSLLLWRWSTVCSIQAFNWLVRPTNVRESSLLYSVYQIKG